METSRGFTGQGSPVSSGSGEDSSPPGWPDLAQRTSSQQSLEGLGIGHGDMDLVPISSTACRVTSRACLGWSVVITIILLTLTDNIRVHGDHTATTITLSCRT